MTDSIADTLDRDPATVAGFSLGPDAALKAAARLWFLVAVIGLWIFVYYIVAYYGGLVALDGLEGLKNSHLPRGYIAGDTIGNFAIALHLFVAVTALGFGPLQLILGAIITGDGPFQRNPQIQARARSFHHWNGRIYIPTVIITSIAGLYMIWIRGGGVGDLVQNIGISLDAVLIVVFAIIALRYAMARDIVRHRRWALRLFMVVSAVWFLRIGRMLWIFLNDGPAGYDPITFTGPFLNFIAFAQYLLPLAILELYLRMQDRAGARGKFAMAAGLLIVTVLTGIGIFEATRVMWLPLI